MQQHPHNQPGAFLKYMIIDTWCIIVRHNNKTPYFEIGLMALWIWLNSFTLHGTDNWLGLTQSEVLFWSLLMRWPVPYSYSYSILIVILKF